MIHEFLIVSLLVGWFVATVVYQCFMPQLKSWTARYDRFRIIPAWRFFAANPRDLHFEFRFESSNGSSDVWQSIKNPAPRRLLTAVWNPDFLVPDVVVTWAEELVEFIESSFSERPGAIESSFPYRGLAHCLKTFAPPTTTYGQFRIVERSVAGTDDRVLFVSSLHVLDTGRKQCVESQERSTGEEIVTAIPQSQPSRRVA